ncbi:ATP-binding cassette domain-containing protein [Kitasatospora sp. CM 4170]|uniref:ATP-binding cassette domain-containing protein n=1 Tax=Kitasatospora aburaviensis TaxID=67265 RepID=A0ABW1EQY0_9ACTN|nr:ATP-binding cassette domain-containing protein [Kitasatospora sp. CM 4170]WNM44418.1 ATP-binding cassette domain-containing protein [Kitasatospora sp. CM 4170]
MNMIEVHGLARTFQAPHGEVNAVRGVDFTVAAGEIVGFLGPNGAGKTTTLRMLTTLLRPTAGTATVAGADLLADPVGVRRRIGYVAQGGGANPAELVANELMLQARLYGMSKAEARSQIDSLAAQLGLAELTTRLVGSLSGGQRRRLDIALGLVHRPPLIFLDEPSTGLDPTSRSNLWEHIRRLRDDLGATVFLSTHYLDEADALCDRILIMDRGTILVEDRPEELKRRVAGDAVTIEVAPGGVREAAAVVEGLDGTYGLATTGDILRFRTEHSSRTMIDLLRALEARQVEPVSVQVDRPTLDDVFLTLTGRSEEPAAAATAGAV